MSASAFFAGLLALCGQAFEGRMTTNDPADAAMGAQRLVMHVRECKDDEIRINTQAESLGVNKEEVMKHLVDTFNNIQIEWSHGVRPFQTPITCSLRTLGRARQNFNSVLLGGSDR